MEVSLAPEDHRQKPRQAARTPLFSPEAGREGHSGRGGAPSRPTLSAQWLELEVSTQVAQARPRPMVSQSRRGGLLDRVRLARSVNRLYAQFAAEKMSRRLSAESTRPRVSPQREQRMEGRRQGAPGDDAHDD